MKWLKRLGMFFLGLYMLVCAALYFIQENIIFNPHPLSESHAFRTGEEIEIEVENELFINALWLRAPNPKGVIIYLHGNKGNLRRCIRQAEMMSGNGYDILMPDYRGYGKSDGQIHSEAQLFKDVQKVYDAAKKEYQESQIVLVGYSLGTGLASYLAAHNQPARMALIAPYLSFIDLKNRNFPYIPDFLLKYQLKNDQLLKKVNCPVTLFHGTHDKIIPYDSSERLQKIKPDQFQLITMKGESHRGSIFNGLFRKTIRELL